MNIQFKKGILELCVLALLKEEDAYGYDLVSRLSEHVEISEGTIYPMLRRFSKEKLVETYLEESASGPPRKYYRLTDQGADFFYQQLREWNSFIEGVEEILGGKSCES